MKNSGVRILLTGIMVLMLAGCVFAQRGMMHGNAGPNSPRTAYEVPLEKRQAKSIVKNYLDTVETQNLKLGEIKDEGVFFVADIITKDGELINRMKINKQTGQINHYGYGNHHYGRSGGPRHPGYSGDWNYCPFCGRNFQKGGFGPGMMRPGQGRYHAGWRSGQPIGLEEARQIVQDYLSKNNNPNLQLGEIKEKETGFEATIVTKKNGDLVDILKVGKETGYIQSIY